MSFIPCDEHCVYQEDGYCMLDTPALVTNQSDSRCVHFIEKNAADKNPQRSPFPYIR